MWFLLGSWTVLARVTVWEFHSFGVALCHRFPFGFVLLEAACYFGFYYVEFLQDLHDFFRVVVSKSLVVGRKVLSDYCDTLLINL